MGVDGEDYKSAVAALSRYQELAPPGESGKANELLSNLRKSIPHHSQ
jgi:hypothetical protein